MKLKFKYIDDDQRVLVDEQLALFDEKERTTDLWLKLRSKTRPELFKAYIEEGKTNENARSLLIDHLIDQCDTEYFIPDFIATSDSLIALNDKPRLITLWRGAIKERRSSSKRELLKVMRLFAEALEQIGDAEQSERVKAEIEIVSKPKPAKYSDSDLRTITEDLFWELIQESREDDESLRPQKLKNLLLNFKISEIARFDEIMQSKLQEAYTWDLWGIAYIAFGGCSDDAFVYFRAWLISEGQDVFSDIVKDPEAIVDLGIRPQKLENFLYVSSECFKLKAKKSLVRRPVTNSEPAGMVWDEAETALQAKFPRAYAHFNS